MYMATCLTDMELLYYACLYYNEDTSPSSVDQIDDEIKTELARLAVVDPDFIDLIMNEPVDSAAKMNAETNYNNNV